jgi:beta-phosphoglucomutase-like phosphatase (HAD superfamily)
MAAPLQENAMYDALLFDLDGTLIDTESLALTSGMLAFAAAGFPVEPDFMHALVGVDQPTAGNIIRARHPALDLDHLNRLWSTGFREEVDRGLTLKHGAAEILAFAPHLPRAVVTSSARHEAHRKLGIAGLSAFFAEVVTLEDVARPNPAPDPYLLAAEMLGVAPARCLVFEDSETGAEAAHRAGCVVVQVPDVVPSSGRWAHHLAADLMSGARLAGLV